MIDRDNTVVGGNSFCGILLRFVLADNDYDYGWVDFPLKNRIMLSANIVSTVSDRAVYNGLTVWLILTSYSTLLSHRRAVAVSSRSNCTPSKIWYEVLLYFLCKMKKCYY